MKGVFTLCLLLLLTGCATLQRPEEALWQTTNAFDFSQTVQIAREPKCYAESGEPTRTFIGYHPSVPTVIGFGAAYGLFHLGVSRYLSMKVDNTDADSWRAVYWLWQLGTLADSVHNVVHNRSIGLRPFGQGCL